MKTKVWSLVYYTLWSKTLLQIDKEALENISFITNGGIWSKFLYPWENSYETLKQFQWKYLGK